MIKSLVRIMSNAVYANECVLVTYNENDLPTFVNKLPENCSIVVSTNSLGKTEVLILGYPNSNFLPPCIAINCSQSQNIDSFKYLVALSHMMVPLPESTRPWSKKTVKPLLCYLTRLCSIKIFIFLPS